MKYRAEIPPCTLGRFMGAESCSLGSGRTERELGKKQEICTAPGAKYMRKRVAHDLLDNNSSEINFSIRCYLRRLPSFII